jgi:hypothetical protein
MYLFHSHHKLNLQIGCRTMFYHSFDQLMNIRWHIFVRKPSENLLWSINFALDKGYPSFPKIRIGYHIFLNVFSSCESSPGYIFFLLKLYNKSKTLWVCLRSSNYKYMSLIWPILSCQTRTSFFLLHWISYPVQS